MVFYWSCYKEEDLPMPSYYDYGADTLETKSFVNKLPSRKLGSLRNVKFHTNKLTGNISGKKFSIPIKRIHNVYEDDDFKQVISHACGVLDVNEVVKVTHDSPELYLVAVYGVPTLSPALLYSDGRQCQSITANYTKSSHSDCRRFGERFYSRVASGNLMTISECSSDLRTIMKRFSCVSRKITQVYELLLTLSLAKLKLSSSASLVDYLDMLQSCFDNPDTRIACPSICYLSPPGSGKSVTNVNLMLGAIDTDYLNCKRLDKKPCIISTLTQAGFGVFTNRWEWKAFGNVVYIGCPLDKIFQQLEKKRIYRKDHPLLSRIDSLKKEFYKENQNRAKLARERKTQDRSPNVDWKILNDFGAKKYPKEFSKEGILRKRPSFTAEQWAAAYEDIVQIPHYYLDDGQSIECGLAAFLGDAIY